MHKIIDDIQRVCVTGNVPRNILCSPPKLSHLIKAYRQGFSRYRKYMSPLIPEPENTLMVASVCVYTIIIIPLGAYVCYAKK